MLPNIAVTDVRAGRHSAAHEAMRADFTLVLLDTVPQAGHGFARDTLGALRLRKDASEQAGLTLLRDADDLVFGSSRSLHRPSLPGGGFRSLTEANPVAGHWP